MDDWFKAIIGIVVAVAFISVIMQITTPTVQIGTNRMLNVALVKGTAYQLPHDNLVSGTFSLQNATQTFVTPSDYNITIATGSLFPGNVSTLGTYNISYAYYPDAYDTGASGTTTRSVALLLPLAFILLVLVLIFGWAMKQKVD